MNSERKYFGTDGIRGIAGRTPLDPETMVRLGKAIASIFLNKKGKHRVLIGKDTRLSGYMLETALASGITSMGADVLLVGPVPTPGVAYLTRSMRADAGIVVSASHNSYEDNGIKIFASDGYKLPDEKELEIETLIESEKLLKENAEAGFIGKATRIEDAIGRYTVYLKECFPRECTLEGLRIGFDGANGAGYVVGPLALSELGAEVVSRGISPNGKNINAGFGSLYPEVVSKLVVEQNLHVGISLDGDADRVVLIDEKGTVLDGDMVLAICAVDLKERGLLDSNEIVATIMSNLGLEKFLSKYGIKVIRAQVGDRYVLEEMVKNKVMLGGEQSGHTIFLQHATTGDGLLTALMVLSIMCRKQKTLSQLHADFVKFPQKMINIPVLHKIPLDTVPKITQSISKAEKDLGSNGRIVVRYSGTENKVRIMVECEDEKKCDLVVQEVSDVIEKELGKG